MGLKPRTRRQLLGPLGKLLAHELDAERTWDFGSHGEATIWMVSRCRVSHDRAFRWWYQRVPRSGALWPVIITETQIRALGGTPPEPTS